MSKDSSQKPSVNRWATGVRMATVIVVLGTLVAVWHPGLHQPVTVLDGGPVASTPAGTPDVAGSDDTTYFPSRLPAPGNLESQAPTF